MLNRFCVQAVIGHPLTVYGKGGQTRGFLNIRDTLAASSWRPRTRPRPASSGSSTSSPSSSGSPLADLVRRAGDLGYAVEIQEYHNPRVEKEEHYYNPVHTKLLDLGLEPTFLGEELVRLDAEDDRPAQGPRDRGAR